MPPAGGLECDEAAGFGLLDRGGIGDPRQRREFDRLSDRQHIDHVADRRRAGPDPGFDELDEAGRHDRIADPPPVPVLEHDPAVGDLLLDDVPQIQHIAAGQLPKPLGGSGSTEPPKPPTAARRSRSSDSCSRSSRSNWPAFQIS